MTNTLTVIVSGSMAKHTKYGRCPIADKWVPRDEMLSINVKAFDEDNNEERIRLRLSPVGFEKLIDFLRENAWTGVLREELDLYPDGLTDEQRKSLIKSVARTDDYDNAPLATAS